MSEEFEHHRVQEISRHLISRDQQVQDDADDFGQRGLALVLARAGNIAEHIVAIPAVVDQRDHELLELHECSGLGDVLFLGQDLSQPIES